MKKTTTILAIALLAGFSMVLFLGGSEGITGLAIADRVSSFLGRNSLSALGPITVLSLIFAAGVVAVHELKKK